jgi:UDP-N-acetylmuramate: L-alanyl-gamma-D-glutamyl-meso-diaminopimelate ligase
MGICGTAMASLAGLLKDKGFKVTGSDNNPYPPMSTQLEKLGIQVMKGYSAENLAHKPDMVIVGNVITKINPEAEALLNSNIPYTSLPKAIGQWVIENRESIVISGTHGKTTTTSLMAWIAEKADRKAGFLIGGIPKNFSYSFRIPEGNYFIIEGDEYDTAFFDKVPKFIHYKPRHVILTSIEFDHADIYKNLDEVNDAFTRLMKLIPVDGTLVYHVKDRNILSVVESCKAAKKISYGFNRADYMAKFISQNEEGSIFQVFHNSFFLGEFFITMHGDYNILNATAAIAMADQLGWSIVKIREALEDFQGIKRRQEIIAEPNGIKMIEDFAHHPTAVLETVKAVQKRFPGKKVYSVFEPRSATSRRKIFQKDYLESFRQCQEVLLAEPYDQSKIEESDRFSVKELVQDLQKSGVLAHCFSAVDLIVEYLKAQAKSGDIILIMSNGAFDGIYDKLKTQLS